MAKTPKSNVFPQMITSLSNGVSQQSPALRLQNQIEVGLNLRSTIIAGAGPRTGTVHRRSFGLGDGSAPEQYDKALPISFDRGDDGFFGALVVPGGVRVWNLQTGTECPVAFPAGKGWLDGVDPEHDIRYVAAGDFVFMAKRTVAVRMADSPVTPPEVPEAFIFCRAANYEEIVRISLTRLDTGTLLSWELKMPTTTAGNGPLGATNVARALYTILTTNTAPAGSTIGSKSADTWGLLSVPAVSATAAGYTIELDEALMRITRKDGVAFKIDVHDQDNGKKIYHIQKSIAQFTDLPSSFWPNAVIEVRASAASAALAYWVQYREEDDDGNPVTGYWQECPAPNTKTRFDFNTMPWALKATGAGTFSFGPVTWDDRKIGSPDTIPEPSFVGQKIVDMFFVAGRLGILLFDGCVTSRSADQPFCFWRETSTELLDTDPIDISSGAPESVNFHSSVVVGTEPVFLSNKSQHILTTPQGEALSPKVADLKPTSNYQTPSGCPPLAYGTLAYFVTPGADFVGISQFEIGDDSNRSGRATPVSEHVPAYIKNPVRQIIGCSSENLIVCTAGSLRREMFVYSFMDTQDKGRVQSSWTEWTFDAGARILGMFVQDKLLHFLIRRDAQLSLETMDLASDRLIGPTADLIVLDRKVTDADVTLDYDPLEGTVYVTMPYPIPEDDADSYFVVEVSSTTTGGVQPSYVRKLNRLSASYAKAGADLRGKSFFIGRAPRVYLEPSEQVMRDPSTGSPSYTDGAVVSIGPILGQTSGVIMRVGSKKRRHYAKLRTIGQSLGREQVEDIDMFTSTGYAPGTGEYIYIMNSEVEEKLPKRFFKATGNINDVLVAFENNGPLSFKVAGLIFMLSQRGTYTGF